MKPVKIYQLSLLSNPPLVRHLCPYHAQRPYTGMYNPATHYIYPKLHNFQSKLTSVKIVFPSPKMSASSALLCPSGRLSLPLLSDESFHGLQTRYKSDGFQRGLQADRRTVHILHFHFQPRFLITNDNAVVEIERLEDITRTRQKRKEQMTYERGRQTKFTPRQEEIIFCKCATH